MSLLNLFRRRGSAPVARERLQILLSHERTIRGESDLLTILRDEILAVVAKHVNVEHDQVTRHAGPRRHGLDARDRCRSPALRRRSGRCGLAAKPVGTISLSGTAVPSMCSAQVGLRADQPRHVAMLRPMIHSLSDWLRKSMCSVNMAMASR